jgi:hypothetical protein
MLKEIFSRINCNIGTAIAFIVGLTVQHLFELYFNKISRLRYSISKSLLGVSGRDNYFGEVQVLYNKQPVKNLFSYRLNLVNTATKDFKDLELTLWCDLDSTILISSATKTNTINVLSLSDKYIEERKNITEDNKKLMWSRRPYIIPVLNRDDSVIFSCLITSENKDGPGVYLNCEHPGLKIEANFIQPELFWGENKNLGAFYGFFITVIISLFVVYYLQSKVTIALLVFLLGAFCLIPGVIVLKIARKVRKILRG